MIYACERHRVLHASAARVWAWLHNPQHLFSLNCFHRQVEERGHSLDVGKSFVIHHSFCRVYQQVRVARMRTCRPYTLAWGELAATGQDWFPHSQSLSLQPLSAETCRLSNRLRGQFRLRGAAYWLLPVYRWVGPWILERENCRIAQAVESAPVVVGEGNPHPPRC